MVRRVGLALLVALALVLLLIAGVVGLAQTGLGKRMIAERLGDLLSTPEIAVEITGLQGIVPIDMRLRRVTAADPDGVWLAVEDVRLAWSPGALLRGRIWIDEISAASMAGLSTCAVSASMPACCSAASSLARRAGAMRS